MHTEMRQGVVSYSRAHSTTPYESPFMTIATQRPDTDGELWITYSFNRTEPLAGTVQVTSDQTRTLCRTSRPAAGRTALMPPEYDDRVAVPLPTFQPPYSSLSLLSISRQLALGIAVLGNQ